MSSVWLSSNAHVAAWCRPSLCSPGFLITACCWQATVAKLFTIELCYLATIAYHLYQLQTDPNLYAGSSSFQQASQLQACRPERTQPRTHCLLTDARRH